MNRRSFFKVVTGFVAGVIAAFVPKSIGASNGLSHLEGKKVDILHCGGKNGTLCPRCKFNTNVDTWIATKEDIKALGSGDCGYLERINEGRIFHTYS